jgi:hypothetical protein
VVLKGPFTAVQRAATHRLRNSRRPADTGAADCTGPPAQLRAVGNDIRRVGGLLRMAVINCAAPGAAQPADVSRVELFSLALHNGVPEARWLGCFPVPPPYVLNDVAIATDGAIYASHQFDRPASPAEAAATSGCLAHRLASA